MMEFGEMLARQDVAIGLRRKILASLSVLERVVSDNAPAAMQMRRFQQTAGDVKEFYDFSRSKKKPTRCVLIPVDPEHDDVMYVYDLKSQSLVVAEITDKKIRVKRKADLTELEGKYVEAANNLISDYFGETPGMMRNRLEQINVFKKIVTRIEDEAIGRKPET
jgi:hypothetical protein